jgi:hypothetical protein
MLDSNGQEVERIIGFQFRKPKDYIRELVDYSKGKNTLPDLLNKAKKDPENGDIFMKIAAKYEKYSNLEQQT